MALRASSSCTWALSRCSSRIIAVSLQPEAPCTLTSATTTGTVRLFSSSSDDGRRGGKRSPSSSTIKSPLADMLAKMDLNKQSSSSRGAAGRAPPSAIGARATRTESDGFRGRATSAISILHGDYEDYDELDSSSKAENKTVSAGVVDEDEAASSADTSKNRSADIQEWEERIRQQKLKWAEQSKPRVRHQELDERGRAYGRGGRKTSTARVWVFPGEGNVTVNRIDMVDYFDRETHRSVILSPFVATKTCGMFDVFCRVEGGGLTGKTGAIRHGIARALEKYNPELRPPLKLLGLLTRDPRMVERKKSGLKKARKAKQWVKR